MASGQVVLEFLLMVSVAVVVGILYLAVGTASFIDASEAQRLNALNDVGYAIQDEIILATEVMDGYQRTIIIPEKADRFTYTITNDDTTLTLSSGNLILTYDLPKIAGTFQKGRNTIAKTGVITVAPG